MSQSPQFHQLREELVHVRNRQGSGNGVWKIRLDKEAETATRSTKQGSETLTVSHIGGEAPWELKRSDGKVLSENATATEALRHMSTYCDLND